METKKSKSLLVRLFTVLAVLCCCLSLVFGLVGCGAEAKGIKSTSINAQGELIVTYTDGSTDNLGVVVGKDGSQGPQGPQGPTGPQGSAAAWSEVCPEAEDGKHATVKHVVTFGTCTQAETVLEICINCQASKLNVGELNADNHGSYSWVDIGGAMILVFDDTCVVPVLDSEFEEANGACPKLYCEACETDLAQHGETEMVPVIEPGVNPCEERHLEVETCVDCHAIVKGAKLVEAKGHAYKETNVVDGQDVVIDGIAYATKVVTLTCDNCNEDITVTAIEIDKVAPTCKAKGYTVFEYTYNDFLKDHTVTFNGNEVTADTFHRIPGTDLSFEHGQPVHFNPQTSAALEAAIERGDLVWTVDGVGSCSVHKDAVYYCADCYDPVEKTGTVVIDLYGKHPGFKTVAADCVNDGSTTCTANCGYSYIAEDQYATGHNYQYVTGSFDASANTAKVKCTCGAEKTVAIAASVFHEASTCKTPAYTTYTTVVFDNGLDAAHKNYGTKAVSFDINADVPVVHNVGGLKFVHGSVVDYTPAIAQLIKDKKIWWSVAGPAGCQRADALEAIFHCETCYNEEEKTGTVVIKLTGEHQLDPANKQEQEAGCTTRGYVKHYCSSCQSYIEVSATDAKGHTYEINAADFEDLKTNTADYFAADASTGKTVTFECACGDAIELEVTAVEVVETHDACMDIETTTYTFEEYFYDVETAVLDLNGDPITKEIKFAPEEEKVVSTGSHKISVEIDGQTVVKYLVHGDDYEYDPIFAELLAQKKVWWSVDGAANCSQFKDAVFYCETCYDPDEKTGTVVIGLSGEHNVANEPEQTDAADCLTDGRIYKVCPDCTRHAEVLVKVLPATGHKFETYTVIGAADGNPGYAKSVCANANCPGDDALAPTVQPAEDIVVGQVVTDIEENCGFAGKVVYTYVKDGVKVCEDVVFDRPATGNHNDAAPQTQVKFVQDGYEYLCYYCDVCDQYIVISKDPIA